MRKICLLIFSPNSLSNFNFLKMYSLQNIRSWLSTWVPWVMHILNPWLLTLFWPGPYCCRGEELIGKWKWGKKNISLSLPVYSPFKWMSRKIYNFFKSSFSKQKHFEWTSAKSTCCAFPVLVMFGKTTEILLYNIHKRNRHLKNHLKGKHCGIARYAPAYSAFISYGCQFEFQLPHFQAIFLIMAR